MCHRPPYRERTLLQHKDTKTTAVPGVGYNMHVCILFGVKNVRPNGVYETPLLL